MRIIFTICIPVVIWKGIIFCHINTEAIRESRVSCAVKKGKRQSLQIFIIFISEYTKSCHVQLGLTKASHTGKRIDRFRESKGYLHPSLSSQVHVPLVHCTSVTLSH